MLCFFSLIERAYELHLKLKPRMPFNIFLFLIFEFGILGIFYRLISSTKSNNFYFLIGTLYDYKKILFLSNI